MSLQPSTLMAVLINHYGAHVVLSLATQLAALSGSLWSMATAATSLAPPRPPSPRPMALPATSRDSLPVAPCPPALSHGQLVHGRTGDASLRSTAAQTLRQSCLEKSSAHATPQREVERIALTLHLHDSLSGGSGEAVACS